MTLLSRTASNLYWAGRYLERAENTARLLDITYRMSQVPSDDVAPNLEWLAALEVVGQHHAFLKRFKQVHSRRVIGYMAFDAKNSSSIKNSLRFARENARAERNAIPTEIFESLNATWLSIAGMDSKSIAADGYRDFFDWVKDRVHAVRGLTNSLMLQTEGFHFNRMGAFIERADNTARLVDVKYHILLVGGTEDDQATDYYRWGALLRALSAFKSYRMVYHDTVEREKVTELLLLNPNFPRSLNHCTRIVKDTLKGLAPEAKSTLMARRLHRKFAKDDIATIAKQTSLHDVLDDYSNRSAALSVQIAKDFLFGA